MIWFDIPYPNPTPDSSTWSLWVPIVMIATILVVVVVLTIIMVKKRRV